MGVGLIVDPIELNNRTKALKAIQKMLSEKALSKQQNGKQQIHHLKK